jgi:hypothetical protein
VYSRTRFDFVQALKSERREAIRVYSQGHCHEHRTRRTVMKSLLIAAMIAIGGVAVAGAPAQAASVTIRTGDGYHHDRYDHRRHWRHHHNRHCWTKVRRYWHHGHRVVKRVRFCD